MPLYPLFLDLTNVDCLIVGGGAVGERKAKRLLESGARVYVVSESLTEWFQEAVFLGRVVFLGNHYDPSVIKHMKLVFVATGDRLLDSKVAKDAVNMGLWCNSATSPYEGNAIVPASITRGPLSIAVSTSGAGPAIAKLIKEDIARKYDESWQWGVEHLGDLRKTIQKYSKENEEKKQEIFWGLAHIVFDCLQDGLDKEQIETRIKEYLDHSLPEEEKVMIFQNVGS